MNKQKLLTAFLLFFSIVPLIKAGADVNVRTRFHKTALMFACQNNNLDLIVLLIEAGANVNLVSNDGQTALMFACQNNNLDLIAPLIKAGANVNLRTRFFHKTALMFVCQNKRQALDINCYEQKQEIFF